VGRWERGRNIHQTLILLPFWEVLSDGGYVLSFHVGRGVLEEPFGENINYTSVICCHELSSAVHFRGRPGRRKGATCKFCTTHTTGRRNSAVPDANSFIPAVFLLFSTWRLIF